MKLEDKLFLVRYQTDKTPHLRVIDPVVCVEKCQDKVCTFVCPAKVYEWDEKEQKIMTAYEGCLECGTCWIADPFDNIEWHYPRGGYGVMYKYG